MSTPPGVRSGLGQAFAVLEEVARVGPSVPANGIARALGMPRASAYRLINTLVGEEYLLRHPTLNGFVLGARVVELAHHIAPQRTTPASDALTRLREDTGLLVHLVRFPRGRIVLADEDARRPFPDLERARRQPASSAIGRVLLAAFAPPFEDCRDRAAVEAVIEAARGAGMTGREHREIAREVLTLDAAFSSDDEGGRSVAVPVRSAAGDIVAGIVLIAHGTQHPITAANVDAARAVASTILGLHEGAEGEHASGASGDPQDESLDSGDRRLGHRSQVAGVE